MSEDPRLIEDHEYDGIQEYDYPLPEWWLFAFLGTIMFAFFYFIHYDSGAGTSIAQELKSDMASIDTLKRNRPVSGDSDEELRQLLASAAAVDNGRAVFAAKCAACHGVHLEGVIGPNLTDEYWIHGRGTLTDIAGTVRKGVLEKGMPPWDGVLKETELKSVVAYIVSQRGTNPPNAKAPQGDKVVRD